MTDLRLLRYCVAGHLNTGKVEVKAAFNGSIITVILTVN